MSDLNIFRFLFQLAAVIWFLKYLYIAVQIYISYPGKEGFFAGVDQFIIGFIPAIILLAIGEMFKAVENIEKKSVNQD